MNERNIKLKNGYSLPLNSQQSRERETWGQKQYMYVQYVTFIDAENEVRTFLASQFMYVQ